MNNRILAWDGCQNVRDLGGMMTNNGHSTRWRSIVRSDTPSRLSTAGWSALYDYGIRTIITLFTHGMKEDELNFTPPYADLTTMRVAIEDVTDQEFAQKWASTDLWCTPLYYPDALQRWPERHAAAISAIAQAGPGGVLYHCVGGYDRTGIITLLLLTLVGVPMDEIIADYELNLDPERTKVLEREQTSASAAIRSALAGLEIESYLRAGGASQADFAAVRQRLLG